MRCLGFLLLAGLLAQAQTTTDRWRHTATGGGLTCVGGDAGRVYAFESETGRSLWSADVGGPLAELACQDAWVLARRADNQLVCLKKDTGALCWQREQVAALWTSPLLVRDPDGHELVCLAADSGEPLWRRRGSWLAAVFVADDRLLVQDLDRLHCLDLNGRLLWQVEGDFDGLGFLAGGNFGLARNSADREVRIELRRLDDGALRWGRTIAACTTSMSPGPLFAADSQRLFAYLPAPGGPDRLFALQLADGRTLWTRQGEVSALVPDEAHGLFALHGRLGVCLLQADSGEPLWQASLTYPRSCGLARTATNLLLWDSWDGALRVLGPDGALQSSRTLAADGEFLPRGVGARMLSSDRLECFDGQGQLRWSRDIRELDSQTARALAAEKQLDLGNARYQDGAFEAAIQVWTRLAADFPETASHPLALYNIGLAHEEGNDLPAAIETYSRLLELSVDPLEPGENLMQAYRNTQHQACLRLSFCAERSGDVPAALRWATAARDEFPYLSWCGTCVGGAEDTLAARITRLEAACER